MIRQYPYSLKSKHFETPGKINNSVGKSVLKIETTLKRVITLVASITPDKQSDDGSNNKQENISSELNKVCTFGSYIDHSC